MALIYQKTVSDKTLILAPREFYLRPFNFNTDWTEVRMGVYCTAVASSGDNTNSAAETVALSTSADRIFFGIKDSATNDLPGFGAALYLGVGTATGQTSAISTVLISNSGSANLAATGYHDTTLVGGTGSAENGINFPLAAGSTGYNGFFAIKFVISNRGTSSQAVAISTCSTTPIAGTDYSAQALRLDINNGTYTGSTSIAWNDGAVARTIPDAVFIRMPFYSNRFRISAIRAIRYAP